MLRGYLLRFLNRLKMTYVYRELINNYFVVAFALFLFIIFINHLFTFPLVILYCTYCYCKSKKIFLILIIVFMSFSIHFFLIKENYNFIKANEIKGTIIVIEEKEEYNKLIIRNNYYKKIVYDYDFFPLKPGDEVLIKGTSLDVSGQRLENGFNYLKYLSQQKINQVLLSEQISVIKHQFSLSGIGFAVNQYISYFPNKTQTFIKAIILGDDGQFTEEFAEGLQINGISHLFAVSGLHIGLLVIIIKQILSFLKGTERTTTIITIILLSLYLIVTGFRASILRACLLYFGNLINKKGKFGLKSIDVISLVFVILLLINPYYIYNLGFVLSFLMAFTIILVSPLLKKYQNQYQVFIISSIAIVITFPLIINFNYQINLLSPFLNVIYIAFFSCFILPFTLIVFIVPFLAEIYQYVLVVFEKLIIISGKYINIRFPFPHFENWQIIVFYLFIVGILYCFKKCCYRKTILSFFFLFLFCLRYAPVFNIQGEVSFLDLANGEAIFVHSPFSECTALIDTGEGKNDETTKFLLSKGIRKLDYLILTHNHSDHNGEAASILENIKVKNIITSKVDNSIYAQTAITRKVDANEQIVCGDIVFHVLSPRRRSEDENDNSLVLYAKIGQSGFLFLGDASKEIEAEVAQYNLQVDVVKIGHHGSITSTNPVLLAKFRPKYAIIQTGRVTKFGFPHVQTISTLNQFSIIIYQTNQDYSIRYRYTKKSSSFDSWR